MSKSPLHLLSLVSIFYYVFLIITITTTDLVAGQRCRLDQTEILTRFKDEFAFSSNCSDNDADVRCDNVTGAITVLELPGGCLRGTLESNSSLFELRQLRYLNISFNNFASSSIPSAFGQLNNLQVLILSSNGFIGQVPSSIRNLTKLTYLNLSENKLTGILDTLVQNLTNLQSLDLSHNQFSRTIPSSLFTMPFLSYLHLKENHLTGSLQIPNSLSKLENLYLGDNHFEAEIIDHVLKLVNLRYLSLSFLNISQPIDLPIFSSLKSLSYLDFTGNSLTPTSVNSYTGFPKNLEALVLSRCNISEVPRFLKSLKNFGFLDLSNNIIKGNVPDWLWSIPRLVSLDLVGNSLAGFDGLVDHVLVNSSVQVLDLALNSFKGLLPNPPHSIIYLSVWNNSFTGDIPLSTCNRTSLRVFDLSFNNFTGSIHPCLSNFTIVNLRKNNLEGEIPDEFSSGALTQTLDVGYNRLVGKLPRSLLNFSRLRFVSVDHNKINDSFPFWLKALPNLKVLTFRSNMFHGPIYPPNNLGPLSFPELRILEISDNRFTGSLPANYFENWRAASLSVNDEGSLYLGDANDRFGYIDTLDLQYKGLFMEQGKVLRLYAAIDFSGNKLQGEIPESIGLLKALKALNLSNNSFSGHIPISFANLTQLESLDLSRNKLSGEIPQELMSLSFLSYMDVSYNQLTGEIPQGTQISGMPNSSFEGNLGLCGKPLEKSCFSTNTEDPNQELEKEEDVILNWSAVVIAFGPGVFFGLAIGHVFALYKPEWFIKNNGQNRLRGIGHL